MASDPCLVREYLRRRNQRRGDTALRGRLDQMLDGVHPKALGAIRDEARRVALFCDRRSGKTRTLVRLMAELAATTKDGRILYINETRAECKRIAWLGNGKDGLLTLNQEFGLGGKANESELSMWFPATKALIEFVGVDDTRAVNKMVGIGPHLVIVDEAQKLPHLEQLLKCALALGPAMIDHQGQIILAGTPGMDLFGLFYNATREEEEQRDKSWSVHTFKVTDNPFFGKSPEERFERAVVAYCKDNSLALDSPEALRAFGPKWVKEDANYVWHVHRVPEHELCYADARRKPDGSPDIAAALADLPALPRGKEWEFTLGCDLGFDPDPFAVVVWAWSFGAKAIYEVCSFKHLRLLNDQQRDVLDALERELGFTITVADAGGQGKTVVAGWSKEWETRWNKTIVEAQKSRKHEHIELLNSDIRGGLVKFRRGGLLVEEAKRATWMPQTGIGRVRENPQTPNDLMDAALYGHRHTRAYLHEPPTAPRPKAGTAEHFTKLEQELEDLETEEDSYGQNSYYA